MIIRTDKEWLGVAMEAYKLKQKRKQIEERERELLEKLKILSNEQTCTGYGYLFAKEVRKGNVDFLSIPYLRGLDLEVYRKDDVVYFKLSKI
jgi:hypothetical protein